MINKYLNYFNRMRTSLFNYWRKLSLSLAPRSPLFIVWRPFAYNIISQPIGVRLFLTLFHYTEYFYISVSRIRIYQWLIHINIGVLSVEKKAWNGDDVCVYGACVTNTIHTHRGNRPANLDIIISDQKVSIFEKYTWIILLSIK